MSELRLKAEGIGRTANDANGREESQTPQRGRAANKDFEQERTEKTEGTDFAQNALLLDIALQKRKRLCQGNEGKLNEGNEGLIPKARTGAESEG